MSQSDHQTGAKIARFDVLMALESHKERNKAQGLVRDYMRSPEV